MKKKMNRYAAAMFLLCAVITACGKEAAPAAAETTLAPETTVTIEETTAEIVTETAETIKMEEAAKAEITWETIAPEDVKVENYAISSGTWFYQGIEDEKSVDMDGLKGFTTYTVDAIPETDGYLQYIGVNPDGFHEFEVYDIFGKYFTSMIFVSEDQFYLGGDENEYYIKWNY